MGTILVWVGLVFLAWLVVVTLVGLLVPLALLRFFRAITQRIEGGRDVE